MLYDAASNICLAPYLKVMQKMKLIRLDQVENIMRERELMQAFDTPFVMQSHCAFQAGAETRSLFSST